jgi:hypothetical protein
MASPPFSMSLPIPCKVLQADNKVAKLHKMMNFFMTTPLFIALIFMALDLTDVNKMTRDGSRSRHGWAN